MRYLTPGFSMSFRGLPGNPIYMARATYNILMMRTLDSIMRKVAGQNRIELKNL